ncbi:unnamed protein product [Symbiodinium sp. KB8]|nr:unnamed protein product [Symbiodinium sp. KB8]
MAQAVHTVARALDKRRAPAVRERHGARQHAGVPDKRHLGAPPNPVPKKLAVTLCDKAEHGESTEEGPAKPGRPGLPQREGGEDDLPQRGLPVQALLMVARFLILDVWGALLSLLILTLGTFVLATGAGVDTGYCLYYGLMCLVNGIFDAILFLERAVHVKYPLFSRHAPAVFNAASGVFLVCPIIELAAASRCIVRWTW